MVLPTLKFLGKNSLLRPFYADSFWDNNMTKGLALSLQEIEFFRFPIEYIRNRIIMISTPTREAF